jgi:DNA gyrase subunit A
MLPHNLSEAIDACVQYVENNNVTVEELMQSVKAPDFPTGGTIHGVEGVRQAFLTGRGRVVLRGKATIEPMGSHREQIIINEIPYQVVKSDMIKKIADLVEEKKIEGITDVRDESDRDGIRVVIELHRDAMSSVVLNQLYALTPLQTSYGVNNVALVGGRPMLLNLRDMVRHFVDFRHEVVVRRTKFELKEAEKRAHILQGLLIALDHLDAVIKLIRESRLPEEAREGLMSNFALSEIQARAILDLRLQRLTGLERDNIKD